MTNSLKKYFSLFGISDWESKFSKEELELIEKKLTHSGEVESSTFDIWGNYKESLFGDCSLPFIDEMVLKKLEGEKALKWPNNSKFAVCLTHDVDRVESYSPRVFARNIKKRIFLATNFSQKATLYLQLVKTLIKSVFYQKKDDEIWVYNKWLEIEKKHNVKSTYFFFVRPTLENLSIYDCDYELEDKFKLGNKWLSVKEFITLLSKEGHEIGLHGSFQSALDLSVFETQKQVLESVVCKKIISTRQHYLRYNHHTTPAIHIKSGIMIDSTLGLNESTGFRAGTSHPYTIDVKEGSIWQLPLIIMDSSIFGNQRLSSSDALKITLDLFDKVEKVGGCLTVNFHPDYANISLYFNLYEKILEEAKKRKAYIGTCENILNIINSCAE